MVAEWSGNFRERSRPLGIGAARLANIEAVTDTQDVAAIERTRCQPMDVEKRGQPFGGGIRLAGARSGAGPGNHSMIAEKHGRVLDEHGVRILGQLWQADNFEA